MNTTKVENIIRSNLEKIVTEIDAVKKKPVTLVCVTKYVNDAVASLLVDAGARDLGENRIVEGAEKFDSLRNAGKQFVAHHIGSVQSNKAARIPGAFDWCQSLSSVKVADILNRRCLELSVPLNATIEVNIGAEDQKQGVTADEVSSLVEHVLLFCPQISLRGLMCIPPVASESETRTYFGSMRKLFEDVSVRFDRELKSWDTLSMGMSLDFVWAIEEGATMVRIGNRLFRGLNDFEMGK